MGIAGIEKNLQKKSQETDKTISQSFEDLSKLMEKVEIINRVFNIAAQSNQCFVYLYFVCMCNLHAPINL